MNRILAKPLCAVIATAVLLTAVSLAGNPAAMAGPVDAFFGPPTNPDTTRTDVFAQAGFGFYASAPFTTKVNQLGFWVSPDNPGGVLAVDHEVYLYNFNGANYTQIASATVPAGSAPDANGYAWASIPELTLDDTSQGADFYIVTAEVGTDIWAPNTGSANAPTLNPAFGTPTGNGWFSATAAPGDGNTFAFGAPALGNGGYFGPNIGFANVPEPASVFLWIITGTGLAVLGVGRVRRKK